MKHIAAKHIYLASLAAVAATLFLVFAPIQFWLAQYTDEPAKSETLARCEATARHAQADTKIEHSSGATASDYFVERCMKQAGYFVNLEPNDCDVGDTYLKSTCYTSVTPSD